LTGSNGKRLQGAFAFAVLKGKFKDPATIGNLNYHIGVPLTLLRINLSMESPIIEMGANKQGGLQRRFVGIAGAYA